MQDVERQKVYSKADFSMSRFLSLKTSRWFVVSTGDTLFLPANLTHTVITLEHYIGVGSFHVGLPGCIDNLSRWLYYGPLWSINDPKGENKILVDEVAALCIRAVKRARSGSQRTRNRCGYDQMLEAYRFWLRNTSSHIRRRVAEHSGLGELIEIAKTSG